MRLHTAAGSTRGARGGRRRALCPRTCATGAQGVESAAHYELRSGGKMAEASVTEEQVQRGERIEAPPLRTAAGGRGDRRG
jgi:hypothetical protein